MPQNFKFVLLLFDLNVEKLQVRPNDNRMYKILQTNRQRIDEIFYFVINRFIFQMYQSRKYVYLLLQKKDFEHKNSSNVFHRLEQNCLLALVHFKTEQGPSHFRYIMVDIFF